MAGGSGARRSGLHRLANAFAVSWVRPGAFLATLAVVALIVLAFRGRVSRWLPFVVAGFATLWQIGTYAVLIRQVDYVRTPRPGGGMFASVLGVVILASAALWGGPGVGDTPDPKVP